MIEKLRTLVFGALLCALMAMPAVAACPYTGNTSGTDSAAMLNVLNDICSSTRKLTATFNRPADTTPYTANDAVADNTTAGSVTKLQVTVPRGAGRIARVKVRKSDQTVATPTVRVWMWDATFTVGAGDNAAFAAPLAAAMGSPDVAVVNAGTDDAVGWTATDIPVVTGTVFILLQTLSAFTPASAETFTVELWVQ